MPITSRECAALKTLTAALIDQLGGPTACAAASRVNVASLSNYQNPHHPSFIPIDVLLALEKLPGGGPVVSPYLLSLLGFDVVPRDKAIAANLGTCMAGFWQAASAFSAEYAAALADGVFDDREKGRLAPVAQQLALAADAIVGTMA